MEETLGPASELDAVNELMRVIGQSPLISLNPLPPAGETALHALRMASRNLQAKGWQFNTDDEYVLNPDTNGEIVLPSNTLKIDTSDSPDVAERGRRLWNRETRSYTFTAPVTVEIVWHLPWDDLPSHVRRYVTAIAAEAFVASYPGFQGLPDALQRELFEARKAFLEAEEENADYNILTGSPTVQQISSRRA